MTAARSAPPRQRVRRWQAALFPGVVLAGCSAPPEIGPPWFAEEARTRGVDFAHRSGFTGRPLLPEITGSGVALADLDGDGDLDAYLVQAGSLWDEAEAARAGNRLFLNDGTGRFVAAEGHGANDTGYGMGVAAGDYDNDGDVDLYVTNVGPNVLLRNRGNAVFEDVSLEAGVADGGWGTSAAFLDLDGDGDLDLVHVNYINWSRETEMDCYLGSLLTYCPPLAYNSPTADRLYRNNGDGTFTDWTVESGMNRAFGNGFGLVGADFDGNGLTDFAIANDMTVDHLWLNRGNLVFEERSHLWGSAVDEHGVAKAGMGIAAADIDDDGDSDFMVVNLQGQTDSFFRNEGGFFRDSTAELGLGTTGRYTRWGIAVVDFDNDGHLDLYEANGMVGTETHDEQPTQLDFDEPNVLFRGTADGRFEEVMPRGAVEPPLVHTSRGLAVGDVDGDGGLDLLIANRDAPAYLLMNRVSARGNWLRFRAVLGEPGRDAHGATVSAVIDGKRVYRDVRPEGSYLSASDPLVHFGLGKATKASDVTVVWPSTADGGLAVESFGDFPAGRTAVLRQGAGSPIEQGHRGG
ncbi:MAG: CRTAC1 family protein [Gammaproteobacteria bacterium]|nr:CRTAC1 family protein [Gammaproteobacteria bacterium]